MRFSTPNGSAACAKTRSCATYIGDHRFDDRWPDLSPAALKASYDGDKAVIAALDQIDPQQLTPEDQLNRDLFRRQYQASIDTYDYGSQYTPLSQRSGLASMHRMADVVVFKTVKDYEQWLSRIGTLDQLVDQNIALMREGVKRGQVPPKIIMQRVPPQLDKQIVTDPTQSPFYEAFRKMPDSIPAAEQARLQAAARDAITKTVVPSYTKLKQYVVDEYLPQTRETVGLWDTPNGEARYAELARFYTTTNLTPDEIHEIGLKEVARIRGEMLKVIAQTGFKGSFDEFLTYLRTDPKFRYTDPQGAARRPTRRWRSASTRCCRSTSASCRACRTACGRLRSRSHRTRRRPTTRARRWTASARATTT